MSTETTRLLRAWDTAYRERFPEACLSCSQRTTPAQCTTDGDLCQWGATGCRVTPEHHLLLPAIENALEERPTIHFAAILLDFMEHRPARRSAELQQWIHSLPVFTQAQLFYVYAQTGPRLSSGQVTRLHATVLTAFEHGQTWKGRLDLLREILRRPSVAPTTSRKNGILFSVLSFLLVTPGHCTEVQERGRVTLQLRELQNEMWTDIYPGVTNMMQGKNGPLAAARLGAQNVAYMTEMYTDIDTHLRSYLETLEVHTEAASRWSSSMFTLPTAGQVARIQEELPPTPDLSTNSAAYRTFRQLLPELRQTMSHRLATKTDDEREQWMCIWIATLEIVHHCLEPTQGLEPMKSDAEVQEYFQSFVGHVPNDADRNRRVRHVVNQIINHINAYPTPTSKLVVLREDIQKKQRRWYMETFEDVVEEVFVFIDLVSMTKKLFRALGELLIEVVPFVGIGVAGFVGVSTALSVCATCRSYVRTTRPEPEERAAAPAVAPIRRSSRIRMASKRPDG